jgi:Rrf2 family transcriptional regulator, nitric oxide-sensitive transcriptional repressor
MQLSLHADYAFRVLIYLGTHRHQSVRTQDISATYGISKNHLVRVVQTLGECGYVNIHAGRTGGVSLAREPDQIRLGQVIRHAEPHLRLVECFDPETNTCPIAAACKLKSLLAEGIETLLNSLNQYSLADVLTPQARRKLMPLLTILPAVK